MQILVVILKAGTINRQLANIFFVDCGEKPAKDTHSSTFLLFEMWVSETLGLL